MTKSEYTEAVWTDLENKLGACGEGCYLTHYMGGDCVHSAAAGEVANIVEFQWEDCRAHVDYREAVLNPGLQASHVTAWENENGICF